MDDEVTKAAASEGRLLDGIESLSGLGEPVLAARFADSEPVMFDAGLVRAHVARAQALIAASSIETVSTSAAAPQTTHATDVPLAPPAVAATSTSEIDLRVVQTAVARMLGVIRAASIASSMPAASVSETPVAEASAAKPAPAAVVDQLAQALQPSPSTVSRQINSAVQIEASRAAMAAMRTAAGRIVARRARTAAAP